MMNDDLYLEFENSAKEINELKKKPDNEELLNLYGLYKQAKFGNNKSSKPSIFNIKDKLKWESWEKQKGKGKIKSCKEYINLVEELKNKYN